MARVVIQAGHCHRRTGSVGTRSRDGYTEQQFTWSAANRAVAMLRNDGHAALVIEADVPSYSYRGDAFVAIHADGSASTSAKGASVGYRSNEGKALAHAWKAAYRALGWPSGFRADNYTAALGGYYGTRRAVEQGNRRACILEFGFLTNPTEAAILRSTSGQERAAEAVRRAVNASLGTTPAPQPSEEDEMLTTDIVAYVDLCYTVANNPHQAGRLHWVDRIDAQLQDGNEKGARDIIRHLKQSLGI